jgi:alkanesulfonate monooxygenase SsuD/methylene tetrahydromethanopterin reductase-like flavin-dependent oxidoreductase (luciferase family)
VLTDGPGLHTPVVMAVRGPKAQTLAADLADTVVLPDDPAAAAEEIQRRREEIGFSYFVFGADFATRSLRS